MILREEHEEASEALGYWFVAACVLALLFVGFLSAMVDPAQASRARAWIVPVVADGAATVFCVVGWLRCRRIIRAWRDERRVEAAIAEARKDGDA
jgi:hypothetical protein